MTVHPVSEFNRLAQLYRGGFQNTFLDTALRKVIQRQVARDQADLRRLQAALTAFESQYGFTTESFIERFRQGALNDTADFMEWNALYKAQQRILNRLAILTEGE